MSLRRSDRSTRPLTASRMPCFFLRDSVVLCGALSWKLQPCSPWQLELPNCVLFVHRIFQRFQTGYSHDKSLIYRTTAGLIMPGRTLELWNSGPLRRNARALSACDPQADKIAHQYPWTGGRTDSQHPKATGTLDLSHRVLHVPRH
jgi:hypothetical protein